MILGVGIDCEEIERWSNLRAESSSDPRHGLFTEAEHAYCSGCASPEQHYAARWCAKEAALKALAGHLILTSRDVEITNSDTGVPTIAILRDDPVLRSISCMISLTHTEKTAAAIVLVIKRT